jgi:copper chaperone
MQTFSVPDMTCGHCKASVEQALSALPGAGKITVDLAAKLVTTEGQTPSATILAALDDIGFPATPVAAM